jgi:lipoprotein-releasing system permease protein
VSLRGAHLVDRVAFWILGPILVALCSALLSAPQLFSWLKNPSYQPWFWAGASLLGVLALMARGYAARALRTPRGTPGRLRELMIATSFGACFAGCAGALLALLQIAPMLPEGAVVSLEDAVLLASGKASKLLMVALGLGVLGAVVGVGFLISGWFLLSRAFRRRAFVLIDLSLFAAAIYAGLKFPLKPAQPEQIPGSSFLIGVMFLLGIRLSARALPYLLNAIERLDFRALVAARHLRAKKSGFLAAIGFLSILSVSVSSCALTTTLSVMGGFRQDLKRKILGNNAHILIDRARARIPAQSDPSELVRKVPGVRGVSHYVSGEVMISSSSNLAGAVLRGVDPTQIASVSELAKNMRMGSLDYLLTPEKLEHIPLGQGVGTPLPLPKVTRGVSDGDAKPDHGTRLSDQIDQALRGQEPEVVEPLPRGDELAKRPPPLPGIVVGQELAKSLRLYLGDEVNIVTPLGALGPTGPMPKSRPFRVAGIFYSGMYEYDMKFAYVTLASAQGFLNTGPELSGVEVAVNEPDRAQEIAHEIEARLAQPGLRVRPWQELNKNLFGALALEKLAMFIALGIAILVASFCIIGTLTLMVQEKGREVAVLKAMGAGDRAIVGIFVLEGTLIGVFGSLLGLALGYAVCFAAENFGVRLNPEVYYIDRLPVHIDPVEFLSVGLAAIVVCLLVTIYPAQLASRLRPVDALRFE